MEMLTSRDDLETSIDSAIIGVQGRTLRNLAMSMSRRIDLIIEANGGNIKRY